MAFLLPALAAAAWAAETRAAAAETRAAVWRRQRGRRGKRRRKREKRKKKKEEGEEEKERRKQAACSLLRNLRLPGGAGGRLSETELYRIWDVATSWYHATQTANVPAGSLVFVRQGVHGALSMMIVGGRSAACPDEFTILIRGC